MTKKQKITYYILLVIVSALFLVAAVFKFIANPQETAAFTAIGLPLWFMYWVGVGELFGTIGLWVKKTRAYAAEGLFLVLAGAFGTSLAFMGIGPALFPLITATLLFIILWLGCKEHKSDSAPAM